MNNFNRLKKRILSVILTMAMALTMMPMSAFAAGEPVVTFTSVEAVGYDEEPLVTTTKLKLTFDQDIVGLAESDITLDTADIVSGSLESKGSGVYELGIENITVSNGGIVTVTVQKTGYLFYTPSGSAPSALQTATVRVITPYLFTGIASDGTPDEVDTTTLTLTFDKVVTGLTESDITVTGADKGVLVNNNDNSYTLPISNITVPGGSNVTVAVAKDDCSFTPASMDVAIKRAPIAVTFDTLEQVDGVSGTADTESLKLTFSDKIVGLSEDDITVTGADKGELVDNNDNSYTLPISNITVADGANVNVEVAKAGYTITPDNKDVAVYVDGRPKTAQIGSKKFADLADAFAAVEDEETIVILEDITLNKGIVLEVEKQFFEFTLDLNGKNVAITGDASENAIYIDGSTNSVFPDMIITDKSPAGNGTLTLTGGAGSDGFVLDGESGSSLTINSKVTVTATAGTGGDNGITSKNLIVAGNAKLIATGGTSDAAIYTTGNFTAKEDAEVTANDGSRCGIKSNGTIKIAGGIVKAQGSEWAIAAAFNGSIDDAYILLNDVVAKYKMDDGTYTGDIYVGISDIYEDEEMDKLVTDVEIRPVAPRFEMGGKQYSSLQRAFDEAVDGAVIKAIADFGLDDGTTPPAAGVYSQKSVYTEITFDINGHSIYVEANPESQGIYFSSDESGSDKGVKLNIIDSATVDEKGMLRILGDGKNEGLLVRANGSSQADLVIESGATIEVIAGDNAYSAIKAKNITIKDLYTTVFAVAPYPGSDNENISYGVNASKNLVIRDGAEVSVRGADRDTDPTHGIRAYGDVTISKAIIFSKGTNSAVSSFDGNLSIDSVLAKYAESEDQYTGRVNLSDNILCEGETTTEVKDIMMQPILVAFDPNEGTVSKVMDFATFTFGEEKGKLTELPTATRSGYKFEGWFTEPIGGTKITTDTEITESILAYAQWTKQSSGGGGGSYTAKEKDTNTNKDKDKDKDKEQDKEQDKPTTPEEPTTTPTPKFNDISTHWAKDDIDFVVSRGLMSGTGPNEFSPNLKVTRGMFVTVLGRLAEVNVADYTTGKFADVSADAYYYAFINWAVENNIVSGRSALVFDPNGEISREEMALIMSRYAKAMNLEVKAVNEIQNFADSKEIGDWSLDAVKEMQAGGLLSGKENNTYDPKGKATRGEIASVMRRFVQNVVEN